MAWVKNFDRLLDAERLLQEDPKLLEFHGIDKKLLKKCKASQKEVVYLLLNFRKTGAVRARVQILG